MFSTNTEHAEIIIEDEETPFPQGEVKLEFPDLVALRPEGNDDIAPGENLTFKASLPHGDCEGYEEIFDAYRLGHDEASGYDETYESVEETFEVFGSTKTTFVGRWTMEYDGDYVRKWKLEVFSEEVTDSPWFSMSISRDPETGEISAEEEKAHRWSGNYFLGSSKSAVKWALEEYETFIDLKGVPSTYAGPEADTFVNPFKINGRAYLIGAGDGRDLYLVPLREHPTDGNKVEQVASEAKRFVSWEDLAEYVYDRVNLHKKTCSMRKGPVTIEWHVMGDEYAIDAKTAQRMRELADQGRYIELEKLANEAAKDAEVTQDFIELEYWKQQQHAGLGRIEVDGPGEQKSLEVSDVKFKKRWEGKKKEILDVAEEAGASEEVMEALRKVDIYEWADGVRS